MASVEIYERPVRSTPRAQLQNNSRNRQHHNNANFTPARPIATPSKYISPQPFSSSPCLEQCFNPPEATPARPTLDPTSPFVVPATVKNAEKSMSAKEPTSIQKGMRAKLFGQGVGGGYLISPMGASPWKSSTQKRDRQGTASSRMSFNSTLLDPFIVDPSPHDDDLAEWDGNLATPTGEIDLVLGSSDSFGLGFDYLDNNTSVVNTTPAKYPAKLGSGSAPSTRKAKSSKQNTPRQTTSRNAAPVVSVQPASSPLQIIQYEDPRARKAGSSTSRSASVSQKELRRPSPIETSLEESHADTSRARQGTLQTRSVSASALVMPETTQWQFVGDSMPFSAAASSCGAPASSSSKSLNPGTGQAMMRATTMTYGAQLEPPFANNSQNLSPIDTTPTMESSIPSPAVSNASSHQISPIITPAIGPSVNGLMPNPSFYPSRSSTDYPFQQTDAPFAIRMDHADTASWEQGDRPAMTAAAHLSAVDVLANEHSAGPCPLGLAGTPRPSVSPVELQSNQLQAAQAAAFELYQLTGSHGGLGAQNLDLPHNPVMSMVTPDHHWFEQGPSSFSQPPPPPPMDMAARPQRFPTLSQSRHVSSPYPGAFPPLAQPTPITAQPRSASAGFVPLLNVDTTTPRPSSAMSDSRSASARENDERPSSFPVNPAATSSSVGLMTQILEGSASGSGEDRANKRRKIRERHPPVGKRLRPGPKPKAHRSNTHEMTPVVQEEPPKPTNTNSITISFDPLMNMSQGSSRRTSAASIEGIQQPHLPPNVATSSFASSQPGDYFAHQRSASPAMLASNRPNEQGYSTEVAPPPTESQSTIPKGYLESCYEMFTVADPDTASGIAKRYRCNIDQCQRVFPRKSAIHSHIQTHLEDKPFACTEPGW